MPEVKKKPPRSTMPITAGKEPQWDLSEVHSDYLVAELIRRGYEGFMRDKPQASGKSKQSKSLFE